MLRNKALIGLARFLREWRERIWPTRLSSVGDKTRHAAFESLQTDILNDVGEEAAAFVLSETKGEATMKIDNIRVTESKAAIQITSAGTIIAIFTAFNQHLEHWWRWAGLSPLLLGMIASVAVLWSRRETLPSPIAFNYAPTLRMADAKARISASLAEAWSGFSFEQQLVATRKSNLMKGAWLLTIVGLAILSFGALFHGEASTPANLSCTMTLEEPGGNQTSSGRSVVRAAGAGLPNPSGRAAVGSIRRGLQTPQVGPARAQARCTDAASQ